MPLLFICLLLFGVNVHARMYQWIEPESGTTQLSGKPPAWYRGSEGGPRVFVFEAGRVIDDTSIKVSEQERELLRQRAFIKAEEDREMAREKLARANKLKKEFDDKNKEPSAQEQPVETAIEEPAEEVFVTDEEQDKKPVIKEQVIEQMRALITDWEKEQSKSALDVLEKSDAGTSVPPLD